MNDAEEYETFSDVIKSFDRALEAKTRKHNIEFLKISQDELFKLYMKNDPKDLDLIQQYKNFVIFFSSLL